VTLDRFWRQLVRVAKAPLSNRAFAVWGWTLSGVNFLIALALFAEHQSGHSLFSEEKADPGAGTTSMFVMLLSLMLWGGSWFCLLRERVEKLEDLVFLLRFELQSRPRRFGGVSGDSPSEAPPESETGR
jgi:hypothetical protein